MEELNAGKNKTWVTRVTGPCPWPVSKSGVGCVAPPLPTPLTLAWLFVQQLDSSHYSSFSTVTNTKPLPLQIWNLLEDSGDWVWINPLPSMEVVPKKSDVFLSCGWGKMFGVHCQGIFWRSQRVQLLRKMWLSELWGLPWEGLKSTPWMSLIF